MVLRNLIVFIQCIRKLFLKNFYFILSGKFFVFRYFMYMDQPCGAHASTFIGPRGLMGGYFISPLGLINIVFTSHRGPMRSRCFLYDRYI